VQAQALIDIERGVGDDWAKRVRLPRRH